jgi:hypothetical protein
MRANYISYKHLHASLVKSLMLTDVIVLPRTHKVRVHNEGELYIVQAFACIVSEVVDVDRRDRTR